MTAVGPLLPDVYDFVWLVAVIAPLTVIALALGVLHLVVRRAVASEIRDEGEQRARTFVQTDC